MRVEGLGSRGKAFPPEERTLPPFFKNVECVRETEILVEQQPPQGVFICDHAGLVINKISLHSRSRQGVSLDRVHVSLAKVFEAGQAFVA